jgi:hypothetical protein
VNGRGIGGASDAGAIGLNLIQRPGTAVRIEANAFRKVIGTRLPMQTLHQHLYALLRGTLRSGL